MLDLLAEAWAEAHDGAEHLGRPVRAVPRPVHQVRRLPARDHLAAHRRARGRDPRPAGARRSHPHQAGLRHRHHPAHQPDRPPQRLLLQVGQRQALHRPVLHTATTGNIWFEPMEHTWVGGTDWVDTADADGEPTTVGTPTAGAGTAAQASGPWTAARTSRPTPTPSSTPTTSRLASPSCSETTCSST